jgi:predicted amidohydrolase YtcJ
MDPERPSAHTVGVFHGRFAGLDDEVAGLDAELVVDAGGAVVLPGFNDVHAHSVWFGLGLAEVDLGSISSLDEVYARIAAASVDATDDDWIIASGFNHLAHGGRFPDRDALDAAARHRPVWIKHNSGHASILNGVALSRIGAAHAAPAIEGGRVVVDDAGRPTGVLEENAMRLVQDLILPYPSESIEDALERATRHYASEGITSVTDAGIAGGWIGHSPVEFGAYQRARDAGRLRARMQTMITIDALHASDTFGLGAGIRSGVGDEWLQVGHTKVFTDGSLLASTAFMSEDYPGCTHHGYLQGDPELMRARALQAAEEGWSLALHAIGDSAVDFALDVLEEVAARGRPAPMPHRIEHAAIVRPDQLARLRSSGVVAVPQPYFITAFGEGMRARLGPTRTSWAYRARSLLDGGMVLPGSSDRPVAPGAPLAVIQSFVQRLTESGQPFGPDERITVEEALRAYTVGSAAATGWSADKGRIRRGMLADAVILADDPLTTDHDAIGGIGVLATILGGRFSHSTAERFR